MPEKLNLLQLFSENSVIFVSGHGVILSYYRNHRRFTQEM